MMCSDVDGEDASPTHLEPQLNEPALSLAGLWQRLEDESRSRVLLQELIEKQADAYEELAFQLDRERAARVRLQEVVEQMRRCQLALNERLSANYGSSSRHIAAPLRRAEKIAKRVVVWLGKRFAVMRRGPMTLLTVMDNEPATFAALSPASQNVYSQLQRTLLLKAQRRRDAASH
jgi:hypothetical protein